MTSGARIADIRARGESRYAVSRDQNPITDQRGRVLLDGSQRAWDGIRRAYGEFLTLPSCVIGAFVLVAVAVDALDRGRPAAFEPARAYLIAHIFSNPQGTQALLSTIASGIFTITSITI